jgi:NADH dehydrogenase FAD-containing subunit
MKEGNLNIELKCFAKKVTPEGVEMEDGRFIKGNAIIWSTGAEAQQVGLDSNLSISKKGYVTVNSHLQSVSHPNIFAAGDCITFQGQEDSNFPPKAGVYAVREGPILSANVVNFMNRKELVKYEP